MSRKRPKKWGNSILVINVKKWRCSYCGGLIRDDTSFSLIKLNGDPEALIYCSAYCLKVHIIKSDAQKVK